MGRKLAKNVYIGETFYAAGSTPPKEDAEQITNPAAWGDDDESTTDDDDKSYDAMSAADVKALVAARNQDRADDNQLPVGTKAENIAALEADDAAAAGS